MAIVNTYVVNREVQKKREGKAPDRAKFLTQLQAPLLEISFADFNEPVRSTGEGRMHSMLLFDMKCVNVACSNRGSSAP